MGKEHRRDIAAIQRCYRWMAPIYNPLFSHAYRKIRRESLQTLGEADSVLVIGVGTGLDLPLLPEVTRLVAVDISRDMLRRARRVRSLAAPHVLFCDGGQLPIRQGSVSVVVLHLVLCAAPNGRAILEEASRVLEPPGRVVILDHFAHRGRLSRWRRWASHVPWLFGTRFDRRLEPMTAGLPFEVAADERQVFGLYRVVLLRRL